LLGIFAKVIVAITTKVGFVFQAHKVKVLFDGSFDEFIKRILRKKKILLMR
jgi:hypothetical protein